MTFLRILGFVNCGILVAACSGSTFTDDGGVDASNDAPSDASQTDSPASTDAAPKDAVSDVIIGQDSSTGDGGLGANALCDPKNDKCEPGLKCCASGVVVFDAGPDDRCLQETDAGTCPIVP